MNHLAGMVLATSLAMLLVSPAFAEDLPEIHFDPAASDKAADCEPKKTKAHSFAKSLHHAARTAGKIALVTTYIAARGAQGAANGYNQANYYNRLNNSQGTINTYGAGGTHSYSYNTVGNSTTVMQTY